VKGLQSVVDTLSVRVAAATGGGGSVTSAHANTISNAASAADVHASTASAAATSADGHANAVSAAVETLSAKVVSVSAQLVSLEVHASAASAAATSADNHANTVSGAVETLSAKVVSVSAQLVSLETHASAASAAATSVDSRVNAVSDLVSQHTVSLAALSNRLSGVSVRTSVGGATSVKGLQSALDKLSTQISNEVSIRTVSVQTASAAATSADGHANTVSAAVETLSAKVVSVSAQLVSLEVHASAASAAATSVDGRVTSVLSNEISNLKSAVSVTLSNTKSAVDNVSVNSAAGSATGLQNCMNLLSNKISQINAGAGLTSDQVSACIASVASTKYSARTSIAGATSVKGIQSALDALSLQISALNSVVSNALSAGDVVSNQISAISVKMSLAILPPNAVTTIAATTRRVLSADAVNVASAALADISGLSISVKNGGIYQFECFMMMTRGGAATVHGYGITFPAMTALRGRIEHHVSVAQSVFAAAKIYLTTFDETASGSILVSVSASQGARLPTFLKAEALMVPSANGVVQMQGKAAGGASAVTIKVGSYIEVRRIN
jgi:hypothetical protein